MGERIIKTGLGPRYKDMLDAVIGQMSDGYWENTPMMRGYWKFVTTGTSGKEVTLNVDTASGARDGDRRIENRFYGMSDDAVKKFFADKIKFLVKEEVGPWERDNEATTDYLSYDKRYRVKDCYYAYEILKGRNARKHPEYNDVEESAVDEGKAYTFTWWDNEPTSDRRPTTRDDLKNCLHKETFNAADDDDALKTAVEYLCEYIGDDPKDVASTPEKIWDYFDRDWGFGDPIPMVLKQGRRVIKDSGFDPREGEDESRKDEGSLEKRLEDVAQVAGVIDYGDAMRLDRAAAGDKDIRKKVRNLLSEFDDAAYDEDEAAMEKVAQQLKELADAVPENSNESFEGWDGWEEVEGLEDTIDGIENLTYELRSCVRGAKTHCKDWKALALYIKGLASNLEDAAELMAYKTDESKKKSPSKKFSSTVEEDEDGRKLSH